MTSVSPPTTATNSSRGRRGTNDDTTEQREKVVYVEDPPKPARWFTYEFMFYYVLIVAGYYMCIKMMLARTEQYNSGDKENEGIVDGWFLGRKMDLSDTQYRIWRENLPLITVGMTIFVAVSSAIRSVFPDEPSKRILFYNVVSMGFLVFVHGSYSIIVLAIALINFSISRIFAKSRLLPYATWAFNGTILWTSYIYSGYSFASVPFMGEWGPAMDARHGFLSWETYFKVSMLRFISYNLDYHWMRMKRPVIELKGKNALMIVQERHLPEERYDFSHFIAYIFYIPLYIAGPISTYNSFMAQVYTPQRTYTFSQLVRMSIKILIVFIGLEIALHYNYYYSLDRSDAWLEFRGAEVALMGYLTLNFMYVKFLLIWRIFRLFALYDGIDTPENMSRCVNNNYTFTGFWRSWHGSFNKWTVRYLYIPLGGKKTQHFTIWVIFFFIGLWHDLWWSWVAWALLNCVFFTIEIGIMYYFYSPRKLWLRKKWYWGYIVALAGTCNIFLLAVANLAILHGFENSILFIKNAFFGEGGLTSFIFAYGWLYNGIVMMVEIREEEKRKKEIKPF
eukprot:gene4295-5016_t